MSVCDDLVANTLDRFFWLQTWHFLEYLLTAVRTGRSPKGVWSAFQLIFSALVM